jgi:hypothetical protein
MRQAMKAKWSDPAYRAANLRHVLAAQRQSVVNFWRAAQKSAETDRAGAP